MVRSLVKPLQKLFVLRHFLASTTTAAVIGTNLRRIASACPNPVLSRFQNVRPLLCAS